MPPAAPPCTPPRRHFRPEGLAPQPFGGRFPVPPVPNSPPRRSARARALIARAEVPEPAEETPPAIPGETPPG